MEFTSVDEEVEAQNSEPAEGQIPRGANFPTVIYSVYLRAVFWVFCGIRARAFLVFRNIKASFDSLSRFALSDLSGAVPLAL